jgi:hypothetical protein
MAEDVQGPAGRVRAWKAGQSPQEVWAEYRDAGFTTKEAYRRDCEALAHAYLALTAEVRAVLKNWDEDTSGGLMDVIDAAGVLMDRLRAAVGESPGNTH